MGKSRRVSDRHRFSEYVYIGYGSKKKRKKQRTLTPHISKTHVYPPHSMQLFYSAHLNIALKLTRLNLISKFSPFLFICLLNGSFIVMPR